MSAARTPVFGDRVKLKVVLPVSSEEERKPGEIGLVVAVRHRRTTQLSTVVDLVFEGAISRSVEVPIGNVTTDLEWATPRETAAIRAVGEVLRSERCASQEPKVSRISRKAIAAVDAARERFDREAAMPQAAPTPTAAEKITAAASGSAVRDDRPHSRACGVSPHPHGVHCSTNCPTCHGKADPA